MQQKQSIAVNNTALERKSRWMNIFSMAVFGTMSLFVKNIPLPSQEIALSRAAVAFIILTIIVLFTGKLKKFNLIKKHQPKLLFAGGIMGFNWILIFEAYNYTTVALATLSYYFAPTLMVLISAFIFKERLTTKQILCFLGSTAGMLLIIGVTGGGGNDFMGVLFGLGAAVLYSIVIMTNKTTGDIDGILRTWILFIAAILVLTPYILLNGGFHFDQLNQSGWINLLILGGFHTGIVYYIYFSSIVHLKGQQVAILSYTDPLVAILLSIFIFKESITPSQFLGGSMILLFTIINELDLSAFLNRSPAKETNDLVR